MQVGAVCRHVFARKFHQPSSSQQLALFRGAFSGVGGAVPADAHAGRSVCKLPC